jgi:hypothetical protein
MITKTEREWIETQLKKNGLKGEAAKKFTAECIDAFSRKHKQPRKPDFVKWDLEQALPGIGNYLNTKK